MAKNQNSKTRKTKLPHRIHISSVKGKKKEQQVHNIYPIFEQQSVAQHN